MKMKRIWTNGLQYKIIDFYFIKKATTTERKKKKEKEALTFGHADQVTWRCDVGHLMVCNNDWENKSIC